MSVLLSLIISPVKRTCSVMDFFRTFDDDYSFVDNEVFDIGKGLSTLQPLVSNRSLIKCTARQLDDI